MLPAISVRAEGGVEGFRQQAITGDTVGWVPPRPLLQFRERHGLMRIQGLGHHGQDAPFRQVPEIRIRTWPLVLSHSEREHPLQRGQRVLIGLFLPSRRDHCILLGLVFSTRDYSEATLHC
jgi:hypothetical protein